MPHESLEHVGENTNQTTLYKPLELPVSDGGEKFLFLGFTCTLFISCQKAETEREAERLLKITVASLYYLLIQSFFHFSAIFGHPDIS